MSRKFVTTFTVVVGLFCLSLTPFNPALAGGNPPSSSAQASNCITPEILHKIFIYLDEYYRLPRGQSEGDYKLGNFTIEPVVCYESYEVDYRANGNIIVIFTDV